MGWSGGRGALTHLGTLHGSGALTTADATEPLGTVSYEIDGYQERKMVSANGLIQGRPSVLGKAFRAGVAHLALADGVSVEIVLADPKGDEAAEVRLRGAMPGFPKPAH